MHNSSLLQPPIVMQMLLDIQNFKESSPLPRDPAHWLLCHGWHKELDRLCDTLVQRFHLTPLMCFSLPMPGWTTAETSSSASVSLLSIDCISRDTAGRLLIEQ